MGTLFLNALSRASSLNAGILVGGDGIEPPTSCV
jgi:hypothetical protein